MTASEELRRAHAENEELRRELAEVRDALRAIRAGEVDALVVQTPDGEQVFALENAYELYRVFVDSMSQGAASLSPEGLVLYANARFAEILFGSPGKHLVGESIYRLLDQTRAPILETLLAASTSQPSDGEMSLSAPDGRHLRALFHVTVMPDGTRCMVVTDVTERARQAELLASREWLRVTLASIGEGVLCCDTAWRVTFLNPAAERLTGWREADALGLPVNRAFPVVDERTRESVDALLAPVLREGRSIEIGGAALVARDGRAMAIEATAAPILDVLGVLAGAVVVFHDATQRRQAEEAIRESEARLAEANRAKDEFLATLSHELRTPVTAIMGWAQMLARGSLDGTTTARGLQAILRNAQAQVQLVTDILDVSRIVSGKLRLDIGRLDLAAVTYAAIDAIRPAADAKGIRLVTSIAATSTFLSGDAERLQQVIWNLLSNAVKFTPSGGTVEVALRERTSFFEIAVSDTGMGISPEFLPRIFERFAQADSSIRREHSGLGLGLSIVRHLVELHGGTVEVQSRGEGPGHGSRFTVRLPIRPPARSAAQGSMPGDRTAEPVASDATPLDGIRVLVVEDEADTRDMLATLLRAYGAEVASAPSAGDGLQALSTGTWDVLVADIGMPGQDGYEFIAEVRGMAEPVRTMPAIALTAYGRPEDVSRALAAGYHLHLAKPVPASQLTASIRRLLNRGVPAGGSEQA